MLFAFTVMLFAFTVMLFAYCRAILINIVFLFLFYIYENKCIVLKKFWALLFGSGGDAIVTQGKSAD